MSTYQIALLLHILGVIVTIGGVLVAGVAYYTARRYERPSQIAAVLSLSRVGVIVGGLGFVLVVAFGLWLVELTRVGFGDAWLQAALALFGVSNVLGGLSGRVPKRARLIAERLAGGDDRATEELRRLLYHRPSELLNHVATAAVLAVLVLMVWKPGA